jgi:hypothetical protein
MRPFAACASFTLSRMPHLAKSASERTTGGAVVEGCDPDLVSAAVIATPMRVFVE